MIDHNISYFSRLTVLFLGTTKDSMQPYLARNLVDKIDNLDILEGVQRTSRTDAINKHLGAFSLDQTHDQLVRQRWL